MSNCDKQIIIDGVDVLKEKINICFILLLNKLETSETIEQTIYDHLDAFVEEWNKQLKRAEQECEKAKKIIETAIDDFNLEYGTPQYDRLLNGAKSLGIEVKDYE